MTRLLTLLLGFLLLTCTDLHANFTVYYRVEPHLCATGGALYIDSVKTVNNEAFAWELYKGGSVYAYGSTPKAINVSNGDYILEVESNSGYIQNIPFSVNNSYEPLDFTYNHYTCGNSTLLEVRPVKGSPPYSVTVSGGMGTVSTRDTARFSGMTVGNTYYITVTDSCGNSPGSLWYQHSPATLLTQSKSLSIANTSPFLCDSLVLNMSFELEYLTPEPYTAWVILPNGTTLSQQVKPINKTASLTMRAESQEGYYKAYITDSCGSISDQVSQHKSHTLPTKSMSLLLKDTSPFSCDSLIMDIDFELKELTQPPYTVFAKLPNGDIFSKQASMLGKVGNTSMKAALLKGYYQYYIEDGCGHRSHTKYTYKNLHYAVKEKWSCPPVLEVYMLCGDARVISEGDTGIWHSTTEADTVFISIEYGKDYVYELDQNGNKVSGSAFLWPELSHRIAPGTGDCKFQLETEALSEMDSADARFRISYTTLEGIDTSQWYPFGKTLTDIPSQGEFFVEMFVCDSLRTMPFMSDFIRMQDTVTHTTYSSSSCGGTFKFNYTNFWTQINSQTLYDTLKPEDEYVPATVGFHPQYFSIVETPPGYNRTPQIGEVTPLFDFSCWAVNDTGIYKVEFLDAHGCSDTVTFHIKALRPHYDMLSHYVEQECNKESSVIIREIHKSSNFDFYIMDITRGKTLAKNDYVYRNSSPYYNNIASAKVTAGDSTITTFSKFPEGSYELIRKEACNCNTMTFLVDSFSIYADGVPDIDVTGFICTGRSTGDFTIIPLRGKPPLTYIITDAPDTTISDYKIPTQKTQFNDMPEGTYTFKIEDRCGAIGWAVFTLGELDAQKLIDEYGANCFGAPYRAIPLIMPVTDYTWYRPDSSFILNQRILAFENLQAQDTGLYHVHVRNTCLDVVLDLNISVDDFPVKDTAVYIIPNVTDELFKYISGYPLQPGGVWNNQVTGQSWNDPFTFDADAHPFGIYDYSVNVNGCLIEASVNTIAYPVPFIPQAIGCPAEKVRLKVTNPFPLVLHRWERSDGKIWYGTSMQDSAVDMSQLHSYTLTSYTLDTLNVVEPTKTVLDLSPAYAGKDDTLTVCKHSGIYALFELLNTVNTGLWSGPSVLDSAYRGVLDSSKDLFGNYLHIVEYKGCFDTALVVVNAFPDTVPPLASGFNPDSRTNANCAFIVPDWVNYFDTITDNCGIRDTIQSPAEGTLIGINNGEAVPLKIAFVDYYDNVTSFEWEIAVWDTTPPLVFGFDINEWKNKDCFFTIPDWTLHFDSVKDNCSDVSVVQMPSEGTVLGVNNGVGDTISIILSDTVGNETILSWEMAVWDTVPPLAQGFNPADRTDAYCTFTVPDWVNYFDTITDNCGLRDTIQSPLAGTVLEVNNSDAVPMKIAFVDENDNVTAFEWEMAVWDTMPPLAQGFNPNEWTDVECPFTVPDWTSYFSHISDNCGLRDTIQSPAEGTLIGINNGDAVPLKIAFVDYYDNVTSFEWEMAVWDTTPPAVFGFDINEWRNKDCAFTIPDWTAHFDSVSDNCSKVNVWQTPNGGTVLGINNGEGVPIEIILSDAMGNQTVLSWEMAVWDTTPPAVFGFDPKDWTNKDCAFIIPDWTAHFDSVSDNCSEVRVEQTPEEGTVLGLYNGYPVPAEIILSDTVGNRTIITWDIEIWDTIPPLVTGFDVNEWKEMDCSFTIPDWTTLFDSMSDNCGITSIVQIPEAGTVLGVNNGESDSVSVVLKDYAGNETAFRWNIVVWDTVPPEITTPLKTFNYWGYDNRYYVMPNFDKLVKYSDNCALKDCRQLAAPFSMVPLGCDSICFWAEDHTPTESMHVADMLLHPCPEDIDTMAIHTSNNPAEFILPDMKSEFFQPHWEDLDFQYKQTPEGGSLLLPGEYLVLITVSQYGNTLFECQRNVLVKTFRYPELITPNGDGLNDWFEIFFMPYFPENELRIYTAMGEEIYHKKNYGHNNEWWEGTLSSSSQKVVPGTYFFEFRADKFTHYGEITVLY